MSLSSSFPLVIGSDTPSPADSYARQLQALLPRGGLWNLEPDGWLSKVLAALGVELARVQARGIDLQAEADPRTAYETLEDWERLLGLPDASVPTIPLSVEQRRIAITQKLVRTGGQTPAYFIALAATCGYSGTIDESVGNWAPLRSGFRSGSRCYGSDWAFVWRLNISQPAGDALTHAQLEAVINAAAPAHTKPIFTYL